MKESLFIVIPAFNEENTIGLLIREINKIVSCKIIVVDDASTDNTALVAKSEGAEVLSLALQLGNWGAIRTGLRFAYKKGCEIALTMDADGQHLPESLPFVIEHIKLNQSDVVIGSCLGRGNVIKRIIWLFFRKITFLKLNDLTSGLKAYNRNAVSKLLSDKTILFDYQDIGIILYLKRLGLKLSEVPVNMGKRLSGRSKIFYSWRAVFNYLLITGILCLTDMKMLGNPLQCQMKN
ncbi:Glycosyl transferase [Candidatus Magnetomoraceae bacterium gMMP-15]